jgi:small subunit ribosomal protein S20
LALRRFFIEQRSFDEQTRNFETMANTPQSKKRIRRNAKRTVVNHSRISRIRTFIKAVESAIASGQKKDAAEALKKVQPEIARGVARGVIHKNTASRKISRLSKRVASLG